MGIIYKINPEIENYIIEIRKKYPALSCRKIANLIHKERHLQISKSSISVIIKKAGLSMSVGRKPKETQNSSRPQATNTPEKILPQPLLLSPPSIERSSQETASPIEEETPAPPFLLPAEDIVEESPIFIQEIPAVEQKPSTPVPEPVQKELPLPFLTCGVVLLKIADSLIGGIQHLSRVIEEKGLYAGQDCFQLTEALIYSSFFRDAPGGPYRDDSELWPLIGKRISAREIQGFQESLLRETALSQDLLFAIAPYIPAVRGITMGFKKGGSFSFDAQFHTVWTKQEVPSSFVAPLQTMKEFFSSRTQERGSPIVLSGAPGKDFPPTVFFDFLNALQGENEIASLRGFSSDEKEVCFHEPLPAQKEYFIFSLWPWQYRRFRKVRLGVEFRPYALTSAKKSIYIAEADIIFVNPQSQEEVILAGCAVKEADSEKTKLVILSNFTREEASLEELAEFYFSHWPFPQEAFEDRETPYRLKAPAALALVNEGNVSDSTHIFSFYLRLLDYWVRQFFFPASYAEEDFPSMQRKFYQLDVTITNHKEDSIAEFSLPEGFAYGDDLRYALRRIKESKFLRTEHRRLSVSYK
ncbi:MAG: hypothetical protein KKC84_00590 [Candidatus Omnitrophica bacterium]|nr:hypothetical protein [Candidatus Omnitrophota bacterium]